ncbi:MAG: tetratricopeptide repeat protein [Candidatus Omnitrophica bacterium]|nr:tetratricopeptide repeat protein [Candidatus Omnitrophota bacterium]
MKSIIVGIIIGVLFLTSFSFADEDPQGTELLFMAKKAYEDGFYEVSLGMLERFKKDYQDSANLPQAALLAGQCYFYQGRYLEALNIFEALTNNPESGNFKDDLYFWMGEVHFKGNNFQKAALLYQKLIDNFPRSSFVPAAYYSLGWSFSQLGKFNQAIETFKRLMEKFPHEPQSKDAAFKLIECLYNLKEYSELKTRIKPVFKLYGNDTLRLPYLYFYLAESEYYLGNLDEAAKNYLKSAQAFKEPKVQALAKLGLGWSYLKLTKYKEAEEVLAEIKQSGLDKKSLDILLLGQAILMSATNRVYEAKKLYEQLISLSTDPLISLQAYLGKADAHYNLAEYAQAIDVYKEGLNKIDQEGASGSLPPELIDKLRYNLGLAYIKQGQIDSSVDAFNSITGKDSGQADKINLLFQIGQAYQDSGEFVKAEETYAKIIKLYPDSSLLDYAQYQLASLQLKRSNYDAAVASFSYLLKKYPQSKLLPDANYALGSAYFQQADYLRSCEIFAKFRDEFKDSPLCAQALYMLGVSDISLGKFNEALSVFKDIFKLDPLDIQLQQRIEYEIADCYYKLGQENEAVSRFKLLRAKYPNSKLIQDIMWWLGQYYYRSKDLNLARRYFSSLIKDFPDSQLAADASYAIGLTFSDENKFEQAVDNFSLAIKLGKADLKAQAAVALADIYSRQGRLPEALEQYNQIIKNTPGLAKLLFPRIAQVYSKIGDYAEAKIFYLKSLEVAAPEEMADIRFSLAEALEANSEPEAAIQQYLLAADLDTQAPQLFIRSLLRAAKIYEDKENSKEALKIYKRIIEKVPSAPEAGFVQERINGITENVKKNHGDGSIF